MQKIPYAILFAVILLAACGGAPAATGESAGIGREIALANGAYTEVSVAEFQTMLEAKDFLLVNVHIPFEGDIPQTDVSLPFDQVAANLNLLPDDKDAKIVLYCRSDRMSGLAAEELVSMGYTNIWNLDGGFNAWVRAGLPLEGK